MVVAIKTRSLSKVIRRNAHRADEGVQWRGIDFLCLRGAVPSRITVHLRAGPILLYCGIVLRENAYFFFFCFETELQTFPRTEMLMRLLGARRFICSRANGDFFL